MSAPPPTESPDPAIANRDLVLPYAAPFFVYVALGALPAPEWRYALRLVLVPAVLVWAWRWYVPVRGPGSTAVSLGVGAAAGLAGTALWVGLLTPFTGGPEPDAAWSPLAFALRVAAAGAVVPVFEELLMRGFALRFALQWDRARRGSSAGEALDRALDADVGRVEPGAWSPLAVGLSTAVFALGHAPAEWPAAVAYGLLMCGLWIARRDLVSCMTAHAVTNVSLAFWVRATDHWALW